VVQLPSDKEPPGNLQFSWRSHTRQRNRYTLTQIRGYTDVKYLTNEQINVINRQMYSSDHNPTEILASCLRAEHKIGVGNIPVHKTYQIIENSLDNQQTYQMVLVPLEVTHLPMSRSNCHML
jgi:hypothetical protein